MHIITLKRLNSANADVTRELSTFGFWNKRLAQIQVWLVPFSWNAHGWQWYGGDGSICIPSVSLLRVAENLTGHRTSLRDVLRHEWAHALADTHRGLFRSKRFAKVFGAAHDGEEEPEYDPGHHVTDYASTHPSEDFAEVFMLYLKHQSQLPSRLHLPGIEQRWSFVDELRWAMQAGRRSW